MPAYLRSSCACLPGGGGHRLGGGVASSPMVTESLLLFALIVMSPAFSYWPTNGGYVCSFSPAAVRQPLPEQSQKGPCTPQRSSASFREARFRGLPICLRLTATGSCVPSCAVIACSRVASGLIRGPRWLQDQGLLLIGSVAHDSFLCWPSSGSFHSHLLMFGLYMGL